ncbi:hypothetical protein [Exercitatus varius]|uniref:hypothetical protein n=1 Tax=Exercitatus varius TaxID=67857 RepID=UPI00294AE84F|nr:hypothetical protein [Exercitatus varius]MDG2961703.1 hypothetical protein [Exercitatus varius]
MKIKYLLVSLLTVLLLSSCGEDKTELPESCADAMRALFKMPNDAGWAYRSSPKTRRFFYVLSPYIVTGTSVTKASDESVNKFRKEYAALYERTVIEKGEKTAELMRENDATQCQAILDSIKKFSTDFK